MLRSSGFVAVCTKPSRSLLSAPVGTFNSSCSSSGSPRYSSTVGEVHQMTDQSFLGFASHARKDVETLLGQVNGHNWVKQLHSISSISQDLWPSQSPQWRVVGDVLLPTQIARSKRLTSDLKAAFSVSKAQSATDEVASDVEGTSQGLKPAARAIILQALCKVSTGQASLRKLVPSIINVLVDNRGVIGTSRNDTCLANQVSFVELKKCMNSLSQISSWVGSHDFFQDTAVKDFVSEGSKRLSAKKADLTISDLISLRSLLLQTSNDVHAINEELRTRLVTLATKKGDPTSSKDLSEILKGAQLLRDLGLLRASFVREAFVPGNLTATEAAEAMQYIVPSEGSLTAVHEAMIAQAVRGLSDTKMLAPQTIAAASRGALKLQARGEEFAIQQAAHILRTLWPRVPEKLPYFGPRELTDLVQGYIWQLQYSRQELALSGTLRSHPTSNLTSETNVSKLTSEEAKVSEQLLAKLFTPTLHRLGELPLKQVTALLTALAVPVRSPDVLGKAHRSALSAALHATFPQGQLAGNGRSSDVVNGQDSSHEGSTWIEDFWQGELLSLNVPELLALACGFREAGMDGHTWPLNSVVAETDIRLRKSTAAIELTHSLLLRLCRAMDLWHGREVEQVLKHLLSTPEAVKPLPVSYFVAVLTAICDFSVPKELPLRLVSSFLDRAEKGEVNVQQDQWAEILKAIRPFDDWPSYERIFPRLLQRIIPHLEGLQPQLLASLLRVLSSKPFPREVLPSTDQSLLSHSPLLRIPQASTDAVRKVVDAGQWDLREVILTFDSLGRLGWYDEETVSSVLGFVGQTSLLEPHAPLMLPLVRACSNLQVHHAPVLHKVVLWYCWCYSYLWTKPLSSEKVDELLELAEHLLELSFQSLELQGVLAENLKNPNASSRQRLALLSALARFSHFPPEFKDACAKVCTSSNDSDLASLSSSDLINAFNVHLCAVFDGPAALKHWLTEDKDMKSFFQVHTSQKWYQKQDQERTTFRQSPAFETLRKAADAEGLDLIPSEPGEVYHVELVTRDAKERLSSWSKTPPTAVVCIKSKEQLRWYVPITSEAGTAQGLQNRCHRFRFMFRGAVQKIRHLQAMGYRTAVVWMSDWNNLSTEEERRAYLHAALGEPGAFRPASAEEEDTYR